MVDKIKKIFDARHGPGESGRTGKEVGQDTKSFQFLLPRCYVQSRCPSAPLNHQCSGDADLKNNGEVSSMPRSSNSADVVTPGIDTSFYKDANVSDFRPLETYAASNQETILARKCEERVYVHSMGTNLIPLIENKEPITASHLHGPTEIVPSHGGKILKKIIQFSCSNTNSTLQESQGNKMEPGTSNYARRETNKYEKVFHELESQGGQLHQSVVMQTHENGLKAESHCEKESARFDASLKNSISGPADLLGPTSVGRLSINIRPVSCTKLKSHCSFSTAVAEDQAVMSDPCHSMSMNGIRGHFQQTYKEDTASKRRELDKFFDNVHVRASSVCHTESISAELSSSLLSHRENLTNNCPAQIFNLTRRPCVHQFEPKTEERFYCSSQRVPKLTNRDSPDQMVSRPSSCRVKKYFVAGSNDRINSLEESSALQAKMLQSDYNNTSGSGSVGDISAASVPRDEGSCDGILQRGLSAHLSEEKVAFGESNKEMHTRSWSPKEKGCTTTTETETPDLNNRKRPSFNNVFLDDRAGILSETDSLCAEYLLCHMEPKTLDNEGMVQTIETSEPSSRWVKRLKLCPVNSFVLGTNSFNIDYSPNSGQVQRLFTKVLNYSRSNSNAHWTKDTEQKKPGRSMVFSVNDKDSPVESLKRSSPWIRRLCRTSQEVVHPRFASENQMCSRRDPQVPSQQGLDEENRFPSIGAMALMGKAVTNFRPCEIRKNGPFIVWNTNGMLQE